MIRLEQVRSEVLERFERVDRRFAAIDQRLARIDQRTQVLSDRIELLLASLREPRVETKLVTGGTEERDLRPVNEVPEAVRLPGDLR